MAQAMSFAGGEVRGAGKPLTALMLFLLLAFSLFTFQGNCKEITRRRRKSHDRCPKLEFLSDHGCQPCSWCDPDEPGFDKLRVWHVCKDKHLGIRQGRLKLWCDNPYGPFPECAPIPEAEFKDCSKACTANQRSLAPGCQCQMVCQGNEVVTTMVTCTRDLLWIDNTTSSSPQCLSTSTIATTTTTSSTTTTSVSVDGGIMTTPDLGLPTSPSLLLAEKAVITWHWIIVGLACLLAVVTVGVTVYCWRRRQEETPSISSSVSSDASERSDKTEKPLLGPEKAEQCVATAGGQKMEESCLQALPVSSLSDLHHRSANTVVSEAEVSTHTVGDDAPTERQALLQSAPVLGGGDGPLEGKTESQGALQALLQNRQALLKMMRLFDQKNQFDRVTWHNVAMEFVGWDADKVRNVEYMQSSHADSSPGDSFIFQVLTDAYQSGRGLLELLHHLENRQHVRHSSAEQFLRDFWHRWKDQHSARPQDLASC